MTDDEKHFENLVRQIKFDDTADPNHRDRLEQSLLRRLSKQAPRQTNLRGIVMKSIITRPATAAAVILVVALGITILGNWHSEVWAVEQAIEALEKFNGILITGIAVPEDGNGLELGVNLWARANEDRTQSGDFLLQTTDGRITEWVQENSTFHYDSRQNTVLVLRDQPSRIGRWMDRELLQRLQETEEMRVLYGQDPGTNRDRVFVTFVSDPNEPVAQSYWLEFDLETKLPVSFKTWNNLRFEGKPRFYAQRIVFFNELPDEIFRFEIPEGATVIEKQQD
ncbi:MAG: hypothetical protein ACYS76_02240 [Planctomycetota bacterium]|jgi:hypothetical protein